MPEKPTIRTRAEQDPAVRAILESVLDEFQGEEKSELLKEIARGRLLVRDAKLGEVALAEEIKHLQRHGQDLEGLVDVLRKDILVEEEKEKSLLASTEEAQAGHNEERSDLQKKIARLEDSVKSVKAELSRALNRERTTRREGAGAESARLQAQSRLGELKTERKKNEESLRAREVILKDFQERLEAERNSHGEEMTLLQSQFADLQIKLKDAAKSKEAEGQLSKVSAALRDAEGALQARQTALEGQAREMHRLRRGATESGRYRNTVRILESEVNRAAEMIAELDQDNVFLKGQLKEEQEKRRAKVEELRQMLEGPGSAEGAAVPSGSEQELQAKADRLEAEAKKWREAYEGKRQKAGSGEGPADEGRLVELEIALAKEEAEHRDAVAPLNKRVADLEREVALRKESEADLRSDVEEITALARAERESHLELERKLKEQAGGSAEAPDALKGAPSEGGEEWQRVVHRVEELRSEMDRLGEQAEWMTSQGERIEGTLGKLRQSTKEEGGRTSAHLEKLRSRSAELAETLEELAKTLQEDDSSTSGNWSDLEATFQVHREKQNELLQRVSKIRQEIAEMAKDPGEAGSQG